MNFNLTKKQHWWLLIFMVLVSYLIWNLLSELLNYFNLNNIIFELPWFFWTFWILLFLFDRYFWKFKIFRVLNIIDFPNINGNYKWNFTSSYIDPATWEKYMWEVEMRIKQTSSSTLIHWTFNQSKSISTQSSFGFNDFEQKLSLYFFYKNKPSENAVETMHSHEWSCILSYDEESNQLTWEYYSWRDRNNYWDLKLKRVE